MEISKVNDLSIENISKINNLIASSIKTVDVFDFIKVPPTYAAITYTGNGATSQNITGLTFKPDAVIIVNLFTNTYHRVCFNSVRGVNKYLKYSRASVETSAANTLSSFNNDGFTVGNDATAGLNINGAQYIAYCWKKSNFFDVIAYTGTGVNRVINHSLGTLPGWILFWNLDENQSLIAYHKGYNAININHLLRHDAPATASPVDSSTYFNGTYPTTTQFSVGTSSYTNWNGKPLLAFLFGEVTGKSKFGTYNGNGTTYNEINIGFQPSIVIVKEVGSSYSGSDFIFDKKRGIVNGGNDKVVGLNYLTYDQNYFIGDFIDLNNTGFIIKSSDINYNASGTMYAYMAWK